MNKYYWLCVEVDEYELPLVVADTARELAEKSTPQSTMSKHLSANNPTAELMVTSI